MVKTPQCHVIWCLKVHDLAIQINSMVLSSQDENCIPEKFVWETQTLWLRNKTFNKHD